MRLALCLWLALMLGPGRTSAVDVPPGFVAETLATNLNAATAIAPAPDGRVFIADQTGRVLVWKDGALLPTPALTLHVTDYWERGLIGLTLHPDFPKEPHLFALYVTDRPVVHHVLSRFSVTGDTIEAASEKVLFEGDDQATLGGTVPAGHQGGVVRFGNDGRLFVSVGEQTAGEPSQRLDTLQGKILRLNADGSVPGDNPFAGPASGKYRAIYALGVRNSFGIAVQPSVDGGRVFFTDVGGSAFEEVNELMAGANYGWPRAEGYSTNASYRNPLHAYPPMVGQSIVGGVFLPRSSAWPAKWRGRFFFADFMKHWVRTLDPKAPTNVTFFARDLNGPVATELAADGSLLVLNRGAVWRDPKKFVADAGSLIRIRYGGQEFTDRPPDGKSGPSTNLAARGWPMDASRLPAKLRQAEWVARVSSDSSPTFAVYDGEWQPYAQTMTWASIPVGARVRPGPAGNLEFPPGTVFMREFWLDRGGIGAGTNSSPVCFEIRVHVMGAPREYGASYRIVGTDAELIEDGELTGLGKARKLEATPASYAEVSWWYPAVEPRLSPPVVSPPYWIPATVAEWQNADLVINAFEQLKRSGNLDDPEGAAWKLTGPGFVDWRSVEAPPESRVRAYLHANCAVCHQPGGASRGLFDARFTTPLAQAGIIDGPLAAGDLGVEGSKVVVPGSPEKSIMVRRLKDTGFFRMPPVQMHNEISPIVPVLEEWIRTLAQTNSPTRS